MSRNLTELEIDQRMEWKYNLSNTSTTYLEYLESEKYKLNFIADYKMHFPEWDIDELLKEPSSLDNCKLDNLKIDSSNDTKKDKIWRYEVTLTVDPNKYKTYQKQLEVIADRVFRMSGKQYNIEYMEGCFETTKNGVPHAHLYIETKKQLDAAKIKTTNGKDRFTKELVRNKVAYEQYIRKPETKISELELINFKIKKNPFSISFKDYARQEILPIKQENLQ